MGSAIAVMCAAGVIGMVAVGVRAETKHAAQEKQQRQRARVDLDARCSAEDLEMWETEMQEGRER